MFSFKKIRNYKHTDHKSWCVEVGEIFINPAFELSNNKFTYSDLPNISRLSLIPSKLENSIPRGISWSTKMPTFEDMVLGTYTVTSILPIEYRKIQRYYLYVNDVVHRSSFALEEALQAYSADYDKTLLEYILENKQIFKVIVGAKRSYKMKKMCSIEITF